MITNEELTQIKERAEKYETDMFATLSNEYRIAKVDVPRLVAEVERLRKALETVLVKGCSTQTQHGGPSYDDVADMTEYINEVLDEVKANE